MRVAAAVQSVILGARALAAAALLVSLPPAGPARAAPAMPVRRSEGDAEVSAREPALRFTGR